MEKLSEVNLLGKKFKIIYVENPIEVDVFKRESLTGQIDYWTHTIRIFENGTSDEEVIHTLWHEIIHGIIHYLHIKPLDEDELDLLALAITDTLLRNGWFKQNS